MAMVVVDDSSLQADSQPTSSGLVWGSAAACRCSTFITWTDWTLAMTLWSRWKHYQYHPVLLLLLLLLLTTVMSVLSGAGLRNASSQTTFGRRRKRLKLHRVRSSVFGDRLDATILLDKSASAASVSMLTVCITGAP